VPNLTISSFNAHWGRTPDGTPFDVAAACAHFDTDLIAVQEVWNPDGEPAALAGWAAQNGYQLAEAPLADSFVEPRPEITRDRSLARGTWGIALLSRLPVRSVEIVDLGRLPGPWDLARRVAVVAEVDVADASVVVAAIHLSFVVPNAVAQLRSLRRLLPGDRPTVIVGDCNLWGPAVAALVRRRRAVRGRTWPAHRPHSQLDHILVSSHVEVIRGEVLEPAGSDHRPIRAALALTP